MGKQSSFKHGTQQVKKDLQQSPPVITEEPKVHSCVWCDRSGVFQ
jgi:hypothetical protein